MTLLFAAGLDALAVLVFVAVGRRSHAEGLDLGGLAQTTWPFLAGLAFGWVLARSVGAPDGVRGGLLVWAGTAVGGLVLRSASGDGTASSFVVVTVVVLGVLLVGWRALARLASRHRG